MCLLGGLIPGRLGYDGKDALREKKVHTPGKSTLAEKMQEVEEFVLGGNPSELFRQRDADPQQKKVPSP